MADQFDKHIETQYINKPYFVQLKRVWRMAKKMANPEKQKKVGFYLQQLKKVQGSAQTNEKIVHDIFGKSQAMSPSKFIEGVFEHAVPEGKKLYIKPETAYQSTQRLIPDKDEIDPEDMRKTKRTELNKTIQVSVFGDIYDKILDKYKKDPEADDLFRAVNRYLSSHFANAANFIRWTNVTPNWLHVDALQTDFFQNLKGMAFREGKDNPKILKIVEEFRKHEDEFFKTAMSYIVRTNPSAKIFTANTKDIVKAVENVDPKSVPKLNKYYNQLPKKLGFKLVDMSKLNQILRTRPGKKAEALIKKFSGAITQATGKGNVQEAGPADVQRISGSLISALKAIGNKSQLATPDYVDSTINRTTTKPKIQSAYHQHINQLADIMKKSQQSKGQKDRAPLSVEKELKKYLDSKADNILQNINRREGAASKIWWANRGTIFESTRYVGKVMVEEIKELSRY